jgi:membrane-bound lytic murein transglycosylase A
VLRRAAVVVVAAAVGAGAAMLAEASSPPKQPGPGPRMKTNISYQPVTFAQIPSWEEDDHAAAFKTFRKSCDRVLAAARDRATAEKVPPPAPPPLALVAACEAASRQTGAVTKAGAKAFFEQHFTPNAVVHTGPNGLLTGYYEPLLTGSRTPQGEYQTPIYKRPPDLVNLIDETQRGAVGMTLTHARKTDAGVEPYATRAAIEQGALKEKNLELMYLTDPVEVFFLQIQGSGRVRLTDGSIVRVHYDGKNGHPYSSIGRYLMEKGLLAADKVSMGALKRWLKDDPERGKKVMWQNASYVFFRELKGAEQAKGPLGAMQIPLTPGRSLAVDPGHHALGLPIYVSAAGMKHVNKAGVFNRLMVAQDVGSAIKGPERGDIYFGSGDAAGRLAGVTKHAGKFIVLLPNDTPARADASGKAAPEKARP